MFKSNFFFNRIAKKHFFQSKKLFFGYNTLKNIYVYILNLRNKRLRLRFI